MSTSEPAILEPRWSTKRKTRAPGLANTLDRLRDNLKPQHVMEEVVRKRQDRCFDLGRKRLRGGAGESHSGV